MKKTKFEYLNKFLTILDSCSTDALVEIDTTLSNEELEKANFINRKGQFELTTDNRTTIIDFIAENYRDDFCYHFRIYKKDLQIAQSFDHCGILSLNPDYFKLNDDHILTMDDSEIIYSKTMIS
jgi:hypothetical protein